MAQQPKTAEPEMSSTTPEQMSMKSLKRSLAETEAEKYKDAPSAKRHTTFQREPNAYDMDEVLSENESDASEEDVYEFMLSENEEDYGPPIEDHEELLTTHAAQQQPKQEEDTKMDHDNDDTNNDDTNNETIDTNNDNNNNSNTNNNFVFGSAANATSTNVEAPPRFQESALALQWSSDDEIEPYQSETEGDKPMTKEEEKIQQEVFLPSAQMTGDDTFKYDQSAYAVFHRFNTEWPCLSFDFLYDSLGASRTTVPHTMYLVSGTQANTELASKSDRTAYDSKNNPHARRFAQNNANTLSFYKLSQLQKTKYDDDDTDEKEEADKDFELITDEDPILQHRDIYHPCTVNRVRSAGRQKPHIVATWGEDQFVRIYNGEQHLKSLDGLADNLDDVQKDTKPIFELRNEDEGFGMAWSRVDEGNLLTGSCVGELHLLVPADAGGSTFKRHTKFKTSKSSIEDIAWSPNQNSIFVTVGVDRAIRVWDTRERKNAVRALKNAHNDDINVVSWNPHHTHLLLTGGDDKSFRVWDMRNLPKPKHAGKRVKPYAYYQWHTAPITSVCWHPQDASTLVVSSEDNQISIWDLSLEVDDTREPLGAKVNPEMKIPPQLVFVHAGQTDIKEVHFHPQIPSMMISTAGSGFHVFQPDNLEDSFANLSI